MANNYRLFSAALEILSDDERAWCEARLDELRRTSQHSGDEIDLDTEVERFDSRADFDYEFQEAGGAHDPERSIWIYSEESGNTNHVAEFVQEYLAKFHPDKCWYMSWADTCSKPRIDEFSGGAVFVTATVIEYQDALDWAGNKAAAFAVLSPVKASDLEVL